MRRLWKVVPPCYSDVMGLEAVVNLTEGIAVVDDSDGYKPLRLRVSDDWDEGSPRVVDSRIRTMDVVTGTEERVYQAFRNAYEEFRPSFALLSHAPSSTMIASDLELVADRIREDFGMPVACVGLDGSKDCQLGASVTLEAMGGLLLERRTTNPKGVNVLGLTSIDWTAADLAATDAWLANEGFEVLSHWGLREGTERLRDASAASVNLVVGVSGMRLARRMERDFGIPYVVGAPYGSAQVEGLAQALRAGRTTLVDNLAPREGGPSAIVMGEQVFCNAIRQALLSRGWGSMRVLSFMEMDRSIMQPGDKKLAGEDELAAILQDAPEATCFADPDLAAIAHDGRAWVALPNVASQFPVTKNANFDRFGGLLDAWLDQALGELPSA